MKPVVADADVVVAYLDDTDPLHHDAVTLLDAYDAYRGRNTRTEW